MANDIHIIGMQKTIKDLLARLRVMETGVTAEVAGLKAQLAVLERALADTPEARAAEVAARFRDLINDPARHRNTIDWMELEDLVEDRLRPVQERLPEGVLTQVSAGMKESRHLLAQVPGHRSALLQLQGIANRLERVASSAGKP